MLHEIADSKLCFLNGKGKLATRGSFIEDNGVLYSNDSFREPKKKSCCLSPYYNGYYDRIWGRWSEYDSGFRLNAGDAYDLKMEIAEEEGYYPLPADTYIEFTDGCIIMCSDDDEFFIDGEGNILVFDDDDYDSRIYAAAEECADMTFPEVDADADT